MDDLQARPLNQILLFLRNNSLTVQKLQTELKLLQEYKQKQEKHKKRSKIKKCKVKNATIWAMKLWYKCIKRIFKTKYVAVIATRHLEIKME